MISKIKDFVFINDEFFVFPLIEKIKTKEEYRRIFSNFLSLSVLQSANYILPLITLPYLVRVLGPEKFGLISFAQAFTAYFQIITDYGFNLSATREISINRENKEKVSEIFSSVMFIKFGLLFVSLVLMSVIVFSFNKFREDWLIYYLTFGMVLGQTLFPVWFFQGIEKMKYITFLNILAKLIFTIAIFIFVKQTSDYLYVPLLNSIGFIIAGILSLWIVFNDFEINFKTPDLKEIKYQLKEGWYIFISSIMSMFYRNSNSFLLGLLTSNIMVGYYVIAEKILYSIQNIQGVIGSALYPHFSLKFKSQINQFIILTKKYIRIILSIYFLIALSLFIFSKDLVVLISGKDIFEVNLILKIISSVVVIGGMNYYFGILGLILLKYDNYFSRYITYTGILNIILSIILIKLFNIFGAAISLVMSEFFLLTLILSKIYKLSIESNSNTYG